MMNLKYLLVFMVSFPALASETATIHVEKKIELWKRTECSDLFHCEIPRAIGIGWDFSSEIQSPTNSGSATKIHHQFSEGPFQVDFVLYWIRPRDESKSDYLVTQTRLSNDTFGLIAECTRYDDPRQARAIATGSCSGKAGTDQIGVSFSNPEETSSK